jgi:hypothetical protein
MSKTIAILTAASERPASVVRAYGHASVCPTMAGGLAAGSVKRHTTDAFQANWAAPGSPWSPPVT